MALTPGTQYGNYPGGSNNPGGGGGYGIPPWYPLILFPVGGAGLKVVSSGYAAVTAAIIRRGTARKLTQMGAAYQGPGGLLEAHQDLGNIITAADLIQLGITVADIVEGSSSHGLVQNGGPPAPLQVPSTVSDILSLGKIVRPTRSSSAKRVTGSKKRAYALPIDTQYETWMDHNPCDKGYRPKRIKGRWHCVPIRKRS